MNKKTLLLLPLLVILAGIITAGVVFARQPEAAVQQVSTMHPQFAMLDADQVNVLESGQPVSTMNTCGQCHDTDYIASHSFHSDLGLSSFGEGGEHAWDQSTGLFGEWSPLTYRYLSMIGDERLDLGTSDWIKEYAAKISGGGPAVESRTGQSLPTGDPNPEEWDWQASGVAEIDCFLCHFATPNHDARVETLQKGNFAWASTATLLGTGLVESSGDTFTWNPAAFSEDGELLPESIAIQDPTNENCAQCHGVVHTTREPLALTGCSLTNSETAVTGQVIAGQMISNSGMNISGKTELNRSFDIHAERGLKCTECHYSVNNPIYTKADSGLEHLEFDPRRLEIGDYLEKPDHNLARGANSQTGSLNQEEILDCESCHNAQDTHDWLPYADRHLDELACQTCHIPELYAPAVQSYDWTVLSPDGQPASVCRGTEGDTGTLTDLVSGYTPVLMPRETSTGETELYPYNLVTAWYWVYESNNGPRPVRLEDLKAAYFENGEYAGEIVAALDDNTDGQLSSHELVLDTQSKQDAVAGRLSALGLQGVRIEGEVDTYSVNHSVTGGEWATKDCAACHSDDSLISKRMMLASTMPFGVLPTFTGGEPTGGSIVAEGGALYYQPDTSKQDLYVFGHNRVAWVDWFGGLFFVGVLGAVAAHGGLRFFMTLKAPKEKKEHKKVYLYEVYERFWHWMQTFVIVLLLFTGLIIHRPDMFGLFSFPHIVIVHNILAVLLVINAALSLFYHLVSGQIRQFIPRPYGFFDQAIMQAKYYLRGIFKGEEHPFEKTVQRKMNPLQQVTYFGILNVLLPLQIITGALMWGVQQWPEIANWFGGLPGLAPFHSLVAWTFASFIVGHVYLTTTGAKPLSAIQAMMVGWEEVEEHSALSDVAQEATNLETI